MYSVNPQVVASRELARVHLGDTRRDARAVKVLTHMLRRPSLSVPKQQVSQKDAKGTYRLLENNAVSHKAILAPHVAETIDRCRTREIVLCVQDTTVVSLPGLSDTTGLGPVNDSTHSLGYFVHSSLMIAADTLEVLGLAAQEVWARSGTARPKGETTSDRKKRDRESQHWADGQKHVAEAFGREREADSWTAPRASDPHVIAVFDREGDIFEAFETLRDLGHGFVIRGKSNRLVDHRAVKGDPAIPEHEYSLDAAKRGDVLGNLVIRVPRAPGRKERFAEVEVRSTRTSLRAPKSRGRKGASVWLTQLYIYELAPPPGVQPLCWWLLTDEEVGELADADRIMKYYCARWIIEEFHMGLKTGAAIEKRQFGSLDVHMRFLAFASIVAWMVLALRSEARRPEPVPAATLLTDAQLRILCLTEPKFGGRSIGDIDTAEALRSIAILGGFMGRKGDGQPGWRTLTDGLHELLAQEVGYLLAKAEMATATRSGRPDT